MKELSFLAADEESLYFIPENIILEAAENEDGTTTLAIVDVINVKSNIDDVRKEISKRQRNRILWHTLSQPS